MGYVLILAGDTILKAWDEDRERMYCDSREVPGTLAEHLRFHPYANVRQATAKEAREVETALARHYEEIRHEVDRFSP